MAKTNFWKKLEMKLFLKALFGYKIFIFQHNPE
jgi:hypothetical protein